VVRRQWGVHLQRCDFGIQVCGSAAFTKELAMKKVLLLFIAVSLLLFIVVPVFAADTTVKGYVSDSMCGAKGAKDGHTDCMNKCLSKGAKYVIVTDSDKKVLAVDNPDVLKGHEGHHVAVTGTVTGDSMHIDSMKMM
jgi:hypothetical protein